MFPLEEKTTSHKCLGCQERHPHTILYNILSWRDGHYLKNHNSRSQHCHCQRRRAICLKNPAATCQVASAVLVKTIHFMRSLPSFSQLPPEDQFLLLRECWFPLFVLGLAQEKIVFEVADVPDSSMLRKILLGGQKQTDMDDDKERSPPPPTISGAHKLIACLHKLWDLDLSPKEYAYLKGAMLFNPDVQGLGASLFVESLQRQAQRALQEVIKLLHPEDAGRFSRILLAASAIQTVNQSLVTELFFKTIIGQANLFDLLSEMLFVRTDDR